MNRRKILQLIGSLPGFHIARKLDLSGEEQSPVTTAQEPTSPPEDFETKVYINGSKLEGAGLASRYKRQGGRTNQIFDVDFRAFNLYDFQPHQEVVLKVVLGSNIWVDEKCEVISRTMRYRADGMPEISLQLLVVVE